MGGSRVTLLALLVLALVGVPASATPPAVTTVAAPAQGPDVPTATAPVATVTAFENEYYGWTEGKRTRDVVVPDLPWNRVVVDLRVLPHPTHPDPWDRLVAVAVGGAEVLRGTTPRTDMTLRKDVTEFAALLPRGGTVPVSMIMGSYEGGTLTTIRLEFYIDATAAAVEAPADAVVAPALWSYLCGGGKATRAVEFPAEPPASAVAEITLSSHGNEEVWFTSGERWWEPEVLARSFSLRVDGTEIARVDPPFPHRYAWLGFYGQTGVVVHPLMWWTAQRALDVAGVHLGVGEIPPYRVQVAEEHLPLLAGARTVELVDERGGCVWVSSATLLLTST